MINFSFHLSKSFVDFRSQVLILFHYITGCAWQRKSCSKSRATETQPTDAGTDQAPPAALTVNAARKEEFSRDRSARQLGLPQQELKQPGM